MFDPDSAGNPGLIMVMGVTGAGKSYFINKLAEGTVVEGPGLKSQTQQIQLVKALIGDPQEDEPQREVLIVDTPGFDDTERSDSEILAELSRFLSFQYLCGIELKGIIYLHRITDVRMQGSAFRYFQMFRTLCGEEACKNVVLLTTMWDQLRDVTVGYQRDLELRRDYWALMEEKGSCIASFDGSHEMAESIILQLLGNENVTLDIQRELVDKGKPLEETSAGRLVAHTLEEKISKANQEAAQLNNMIVRGSQGGRDEHTLRESKKKAEVEVETQQRRRNKLKKRIGLESKQKVEAQKHDGSTRRGTTIAVFASLMSLTVNLVFAILPLVGVM